MTYRPEQPARHLWRKLGATLACLLWLAGFEVVPGVHQAFHDAWGAHQHEGAPSGATKSTARARQHHVPAGLGSGHAHDGVTGHAHGGDGDHTHSAEGTSGIAARFSWDSQLASLASRSDRHGAHALAHRGVVALATPDAWPHCASASIASADLRGEPDGLIIDRAPTTNRARGPPFDSTSV